MEHIIGYGDWKLQQIGKDEYGIPEFVTHLIYKKYIEPALYFLLDCNWNLAEPFMPQRYIDELQGIADGAEGKVDYMLLRRINLLPELMRATCSILGAWGPATDDEKLYHLRALDWDAEVPVSQYPSIVIYDSVEEGSNVFANIGFIGMIGTFTAMSQKGISVGEKYFSGYSADRTYMGEPWMWVLRDTVQFSNNLAEVEYNLENAHRTMMVHLGWGSAPDNRFEGCNYAANYVEFFDDHHYQSPFSDSHPELDGVVYWANGCVTQILKEHHNGTEGNIDPMLMFRDMCGRGKTGDT